MREEKYKAANTSTKNYPLTELTETIMTKIFWILDRGQDEPGRHVLGQQAAVFPGYALQFWQLKWEETVNKWQGKKELKMETLKSKQTILTHLPAGTSS